MHFAPVGSDEEGDEGVVRSHFSVAMCAEPCWRRDEVVVDPLCDTATLFSLAQAQRGYDVPLAAAEYREQAIRGRSVGLKVEAVALEHNVDTVPSRQFKRFLYGHSRAVHLGGFAGLSSDAVAVVSAADGGATMTVGIALWPEVGSLPMPL
jgi:hypothetical protein